VDIEWRKMKASLRLKGGKKALVTPVNQDRKIRYDGKIEI
jgi:hypothetical protein